MILKRKQIQKDKEREPKIKIEEMRKEMNKPGISEAERNKLNKNITAMISRSKEDMVIGNSLEII